MSKTWIVPLIVECSVRVRVSAKDADEAAKMAFTQSIPQSECEVIEGSASIDDYFWELVETGEQPEEELEED